METAGPKGVIVYYSATGNTQLAVRYLARKLGSVRFTPVDMTRGRLPDISGAAAVGFATFTDWGNPPEFFLRTVRGMPEVVGVPAFVLTTSAGMPAKTVKTMAKEVGARGYDVVGGWALNMPESYVPIRLKGRTWEENPRDKDLDGFDAFIAELDGALAGCLGGERTCAPMKTSLLGALMPAMSRESSKKRMGPKFADPDLCVECHLCGRVCAYGAISYAPKPVFDESKCFGCWACFNRCPHKAIYTQKARGGGHYPGPPDEVKRKFRARGLQGA